MPWSSITPWPRLSKRWIPLSIGKITIPRISVRKTNCAIQWIVIYPVDSAIHLLINWRLMVISIKFLLVITKIRLPKMVTKTNDVNTWINILPTQTGCLGSCAPESATNPIGHSHRYEPTVLLQTWLSPQASRDWHSSKSKTVTKKILQYCLSVPQGGLINAAHALIIINARGPRLFKRWLALPIG